MTITVELFHQLAEEGRMITHIKAQAMARGVRLTEHQVKCKLLLMKVKKAWYAKCESVAD